MIKLVVVEDMDILREEIVAVLSEQEDMQVLAAFARADESVPYILQNQPDIVLMDIELETPKSGISAAQQILTELPQLRVLYLTAYETEDLILEAMSFGAADYVIKEVPDERLVQKVRNAFEDQVAMDARVNKTLLKEYSRLRYSERSLLFFITNVGRLTPAEQEIIGYILEGKTNREIAQLRCVEQVTIKSQVRTLLTKFCCTRRKELINIIQSLNLEYLFINRKGS